MKIMNILPIAFIFLFACGATEEAPVPTKDVMQITSPEFEHTASIPSMYTCDGENVNPPLEFSSVPDEATSLVLIMEDPDVPKSIREDGMWDHWVVFNIPMTVKKIEKDSVPEGVLGANTKGENKYGGPCPPDREHRYFFKLFALESELDLEEGATKAQVEEAMEGKVIEVAQLIGRYEREKN
ncbi:MAG: YbhB/YbcL family Raf kinase inhibitor-like protein [Candidatus Peribacteraceae bacterium]|jgi:hypothetical protein|nr:YbhB/YbcL family Raf kinase inhibitor-like protein [Candidatus Peribacteraceae bacterium]MDP7454320.1 YbhB/YbcL family Raf kinase inhibitor-like protein [Candidatus Peribacteraceae bacterium]MDP7645718.1 YbhB/YbcL family Raf kinase inhibitor-like protein [Candidatus Peribacteraceae bacterium]|tara:strand:- start:1803 stop:2351 length:549 start_codon:yes stop_codon:yes gene_type:complete